MTRTRPIVAALTTFALSVALLASSPTPAHALTAVGCASLDTTPVYQTVSSSGANLLTTSLAEAQTSVNKYGFRENLGVAFRAGKVSDTGLTAIHRLYSSKRGDFAYAGDPDELATLKEAGYADQGTNFYAALTDTYCTKPVYRYLRSGKHRYSTDKESTALLDDGWTADGVAFYAAADPTVYPAPTWVSSVAVPDPDTADPEFTFAVIPDTQQEVKSGTRMDNRNAYLVKHRSWYDTRFVIQVGDLVDWDTPDHSQYEVAKRAMGVLEAGKMPYFLNIGNHDNQATCEGGGACDYRFTSTLVRDTRTFNQYFSTKRYGAPTGAYEPGKVDNTYTTIGAGGRKWLILNLELWPRKSVVTWAQSVVTKYPGHRVILTTHSYLSSDGSISTSAAYGSTSPKYLYDNLIRKYANIRFVLCGHVGTARTRFDTGVNGNRIVTFLQTYHSNTTNPVRYVRVNTAKSTVVTWVQGPYTNQRLLGVTTYTGIKF